MLCVPSFFTFPPPLTSGIIEIAVELHLGPSFPRFYQLNQPTRVTHSSSCHHPSVVLQLPLPCFLLFSSQSSVPRHRRLFIPHIILFFYFLPSPSSPIFYCLVVYSFNGEKVLARYLSPNDWLLVIATRVTSKGPRYPLANLYHASITQTDTAFR